MADKMYKIEAPDGRMMTISGPEGATSDQIMQAAQSAYKAMPAVSKESSAAPAEQPERGIGSTLLHAVGALPKSAANLVGGLAHSVTNPVQTAGGINDALRGAAMNIPGADMSRLSPEDAARAKATSGAIAADYSKTYGSWAGFKNKLATDPLAPLMDATTVLSGGAGLVGKTGTVGKVLNTASKVTNPLTPIEMGINALASGGAKVAGTVNDLARGRSAELVAGKIARDATAAGGDTYQALKARGNRPDLGEVAAQLAKDEETLAKFKGMGEKEKLDTTNRIAETKQILDGQAGLNRLVDETKGSRFPEVNGVVKAIPVVGKRLGLGTKLANGTLDLIQSTGKFKTETLQKLADGMATGKSANDLLATLPTAEQSKLLQLLQSNPRWLTNPAVTARAQGVNMLNSDRDQ